MPPSPGLSRLLLLREIPMSQVNQNVSAPKYVVDGGLLILIGAATVEQTGMLPGETYAFLATDPAVCRWGADDASAADGGFDFLVPPGILVFAVCPSGDTAINVIELSAASAATAAMGVSRVLID